MKYILWLLLVFIVSMSYAQSKVKAITEFSQNDTINIILIDVRTPQEYSAGYMNNALNINWYDVDFLKQIQSIAIDKEKVIYLYCKKGVRSAKAAHVLDSLGYTVVDLEGGYDAYLKR